jgi:hypothetical protein
MRKHTGLRQTMVEVVNAGTSGAHLLNQCRSFYKAFTTKKIAAYAGSHCARAVFHVKTSQKAAIDMPGAGHSSPQFTVSAAAPLSKLPAQTAAARSAPAPLHATDAAPAQQAPAPHRDHLRHLRHELRNGCQRIGFRLLHHLADGLLDQFTVGQPRRVGFCQLLLDGQVFLS